MPASPTGTWSGATEPSTECQGHLAGSRYGPRLSRRLPNGKAFRTQAGWLPAAPGSGDHPDRARGRSPGRLRQRSSGPRPANEENYRRTRLFVLTLGYSRKSVRLLAWRSSARIWSEFHEKAFRRLGGCPRVVVLDNLKEGVLVPDVYDPRLIHCFAMCSPTMAWWLCLAGSGMRIAKGK